MSETVEDGRISKPQNVDTFLCIFDNKSLCIWPKEEDNKTLKVLQTSSGHAVWKSLRGNTDHTAVETDFILNFQVLSHIGLSTYL